MKREIIIPVKDVSTGSGVDTLKNVYSHDKKDNL